MPAEDIMWQAVISNDHTYDREFVYAVQSTGIFCRPSCKSRRPLRQNVTFFSTCAEAEQAGYRPCKRCTPKAATDPQVNLISQICAYIDTHATTEKITLHTLANEFHLSRYHLQRTFKAAMGISPHQYTTAVRNNAFKNHLKESTTVTEAIYNAGFESTSTAYKNTGIQPASYRKGGAGATIRYSTAQTDPGIVLVAMTKRGVCSVGLGDDRDAMIAALHEEFHAAEITEDKDMLADALETVLQHIAGDVPHIDLPLDIQATAFQKRVWEALRDIPYGETRTYGEIAAAIGSPKAARAVGNACASNPVALVIPCHRVIKTGGDVNHYRWGKSRKATLLDHERRAMT
ncbi:MAG: bifunctional DNA-binding transcriptional regulator/O6-methylguanine-DNA methyltransferase Ada [Chloroflexota bacterium]